MPKEFEFSQISDPSLHHVFDKNVEKMIDRLILYLPLKRLKI